MLTPDFDNARSTERVCGDGFHHNLRFKKGRGRESVNFTTGATRVDDKSHVVLPRIGRVRTHEPTTALLEKLQAGKARILRATVSREGGRWFVSFTCVVEREPGQPKRPDTVVGVDTGLRHLAVLSTGEKLENPRPLKKALRWIARLNRELARRQPGSRNWEETRRRLARAHVRVANILRDAWHQRGWRRPMARSWWSGSTWRG